MVKCNKLSLYSLLKELEVEPTSEDFQIIGFTPFDEAKPNTITFYTGNNPQKLKELASNIAVFCSRNFLGVHQGIIPSDDPYYDIIKCINLYHSSSNQTQSIIDPTSHIGPNCVIDKTAIVGARCVLEANVFVGPNVVIQDDVKIQSGAVIGNRGFGFLRDRPNKHAIEIPHHGGVVLEDSGHVGANTVISAGFLKPTRIGQNTKIDSLVMIGHNCSIGKNCYLAGQVGLAGSVTLEDGVLMGGGSQISQGLYVESGAQFTARAGVIGNVPANEVYSGFPAQPHKKWLKGQAWLRKNQP